MTKVSFSFWDMGMEFGIGIVGLALLDWHFWIFVLSGYPPVYTHSLLLWFPFKNGDDGDEKDGLAGSDLYVIVM
jgi:hypothetical protein